MATIPVHPPGVGHDENQRATIIVVDPRTLLRGCVVRTLKAEFPDLDIAEVISPQRCAFLGLVAPRLVILGFTAETLCEAQMTQDIEILRTSFPETPIALICDDDEQSLQYAIRFGCNGYVPTSLPLEIAVAALRLVLVGGLYFPQTGRGNARTSNAQPSSGRTSNAQTSNGHAANGHPTNGQAGNGHPGNGHAGNGHAENGHIPLAPALPMHHGPGAITMPEAAGPPAALVVPAPAPAAASLPGFTPREAQVIEALQRGRSNKVIAGDLNLSENTVKVHVRHIMRKLKATNRTQAALRSQVLRGPELPLI